MGWFAILLPFFQSIFAKQFKDLCPDPVSGQTEDPQAELEANLIPGTREFKPAFIRKQRPAARRSVRASNKGKRRRDPSYVPLNQVDYDAETTKFFLHILDSPKSYVTSGYAVGCASPLTDDE